MGPRMKLISSKLLKSWWILTEMQVKKDILFESKYSIMVQVKFVEDSL